MWFKIESKRSSLGQRYVVRCNAELAGKTIAEERVVKGAPEARKTAEILASSLNVTATVYGADAAGEYVYGVYEVTEDASEASSPIIKRLFAVRERFFAPRLRVKSYDELNAWLANKCVEYAKAPPHPERPERTVWEAFEEERPKLVPYRGRFDGFHALPASVSKTCLVRFDKNKYSVSASAIGRPVEVQAYADRIVIRQDGRVVGEHRRSFGRGETIYDPWHYVPVPARCARNGQFAERLGPLKQIRGGKQR